MTNPVEQREKLLLAKAEIIELLKRHGLVGHVVMAGQLGLSEVLMYLEAPWCKAMVERQPEGGDRIRLRSMLADYRRDKEAKKRDLESTLGALSSMGELCAMAGMALLEVSTKFDEHVGAEHTPLRRDDPQ